MRSTRRRQRSGYNRRPRAVSSVGRAPARQAGGHWFEPSTAHPIPLGYAEAAWLSGPQMPGMSGLLVWCTPRCTPAQGPARRFRTQRKPALPVELSRVLAWCAAVRLRPQYEQWHRYDAERRMEPVGRPLPDVCRWCCRDRIRSWGTRRQGTFRSSRRRPCSPPETCLATRSSGARRSAVVRRPTGTPAA